MDEGLDNPDLEVLVFEETMQLLAEAFHHSMVDGTHCSCEDSAKPD